MFTVTRTINGYELRRLAMLADWQLIQQGYDPQQITAAAVEMDEKILVRRAAVLERSRLDPPPEEGAA